MSTLDVGIVIGSRHLLGREHFCAESDYEIISEGEITLVRLKLSVVEEVRRVRRLKNLNKYDCADCAFKRSNFFWSRSDEALRDDDLVLAWHYGAMWPRCPVPLPKHVLFFRRIFPYVGFSLVSVFMIGCFLVAKDWFDRWEKADEKEAVLADPIFRKTQSDLFILKDFALGFEKTFQRWPANLYELQEYARNFRSSDIPRDQWGRSYHFTPPDVRDLTATFATYGADGNEVTTDGDAMIRFDRKDMGSGHSNSGKLEPL